MNGRNALIVTAIAVVAFAAGFAGARASGGDKAPQKTSAGEASLPAAGKPATGVQVAELGSAAALPALKAKARRKTRKSSSSGGGDSSGESQESTRPDTRAPSSTPAPAKPQPTAAPPKPKPKPTAAPPTDDSGGGD